MTKETYYQEKEMLISELEDQENYNLLTEWTGKAIKQLGGKYVSVLSPVVEKTTELKNALEEIAEIADSPLYPQDSPYFKIWKIANDALTSLSEKGEEQTNEDINNTKNHLLNMVRFVKNNHQYCHPDGWKDENKLGETLSDRDILDRFCASKFWRTSLKDEVKCTDCGSLALYNKNGYIRCEKCEAVYEQVKD